MYCMLAVTPVMRAQSSGTIVNVSSWAGKHVSPLTGPAYSATKYAVVALTHSFNMEKFRDNLRACCICPAEVATPILEQRPVAPSAEDMARRLQPEDLASGRGAAACLRRRDRHQPDLESELSDRSASLRAVP